jgi:hypothetical protein
MKLGANGPQAVLYLSELSFHLRMLGIDLKDRKHPERRSQTEDCRTG